MKKLLFITLSMLCTLSSVYGMDDSHKKIIGSWLCAWPPQRGPSTRLIEQWNAWLDLYNFTSPAPEFTPSTIQKEAAVLAIKDRLSHVLAEDIHYSSKFDEEFSPLFAFYFNYVQSPSNLSHDKHKEAQSVFKSMITWPGVDLRHERSIKNYPHAECNSIFTVEKRTLLTEIAADYYHDTLKFDLSEFLPLLLAPSNDRDYLLSLIRHRAAMRGDRAIFNTANDALLNTIPAPANIDELV